MIIFIFTVLFICMIQISNKKNGLSNNNSRSSIGYDRSDNLKIIGLFFASIILQFTFGVFNTLTKLIVISLFIPIFGFLLYLINLSRDKKIKNETNTIINIVKSINRIIPFVDQDNIDFNDLPFTFEYGKGKTLEKITIDTERSDVKAKEELADFSINSLNKRFPKSQWVYNIDYQKQELTFTGLPLPPSIAYWAGSDYRNDGWIPVGVNGFGEVGWNISSPKDNGVSEYLDDEGNPIKEYPAPAIPQALMVGSTGGGKAIYINSVVEVIDEDKD